MSEIKGRGSVVRLEDKPRSRCRKWRLVVDMGVDPITKKRRTPKTRRFPSRKEVADGAKGTYSEAQEALRRFIADVDGGMLCGDRTTVAALAGEWMEARRKGRAMGNLASGTLRRDGVRMRTIVAWMGKALVRDVGPDTVSDFYLAMLDGSASLSGRPLSGTTARGVAVALGSMMGFAVKRKIISENPCAGVGKPKVDTAEKEALTIDQVRVLVGRLLEPPLDARRVGVLLCVACGLSREELLGLTWGCVSDGVLAVVRALNADDPEPGATKTPHRRRLIPLHPRVVGVLGEWREAQAAELAKLMIGQGRETPIVTSAVGGYVHPENFARWWRKWRDGCGLAGVGLHQLRHTFATHLVSEDRDLITAAGLMGHSGTDMLEKVYAHIVPERLVEAMTVVGDRMFSEAEIGIPVGIPKCSAEDDGECPG